MSSENALLSRVWELERSLATAVRVNESLRQQLADSQKQVNTARDYLERLACLGNGDRHGNSNGNCLAIEALAATNDLDHLILCEREPHYLVEDVTENGKNVFNAYRAARWPEC